MTTRKVIHRGSPDESGALATDQMASPAIDRWMPGNVLETPPDTGDYRYRWIAEYVNGLHNSRRVQQALREGYERVTISDLPDGSIVDEDTAGDGYARTGGLILMRIPKVKVEQRRAYYAQKSALAARAVDTLQGVRPQDTVYDDRGSRALDGAEAGAALRNLT